MQQGITSEVLAILRCIVLIDTLDEQLHQHNTNIHEIFTFIMPLTSELELDSVH